jgi:hypothetical protein
LPNSGLRWLLARAEVLRRLVGFNPQEEEETATVNTRPRTKFVMQLKERRCPKCGAKLNNQVKRCKRCHEVQKKPKK